MFMKFAFFVKAEQSIKKKKKVGYGSFGLNSEDSLWSYLMVSKFHRNLLK